MEPGIEPVSSGILVRFIITEPQQELPRAYCKWWALTDNDITNLNSNFGNAEKRAPDCRMVGSEIFDSLKSAKRRVSTPLNLANATNQGSPPLPLENLL